MVKIERCEEQGAWHHVMNRGLAQRTVFENRADARVFLALVAKVVGRSLIEVHVYCLMTTHFHILVRSPSGRLSEAMRLIQSAYVRWFNRSRQRDGPLFRGRFCSRRIRSEAHWANVIRYIDENAEEARIAHDSAEYPYCSKYHYARARGPVWLSRGEVEREVCKREWASAYSPESYSRAWSRDTAQPELVLRRLGRARLGSDRFDDLVGSSPQAVQDWMLEQANLADGTAPGSPVASLPEVMAWADAGERPEPDWRIRSKSQRRPGWPILRTGLLRIAAGLLQREIAPVLGCSESAVRRMIALNAELLGRDAEYRAKMAGALRSVHFAREEMDRAPDSPLK